MTREEKIICKDFLNDADKTHSCNEYKLLMELLEQEPVLDKIRAEIEQEIIPRNSDQYDHEAMWQNMGLRMSLKVINKYKSETEDT